jgi:putative heme-binding domain-containing protein
LGPDFVTVKAGGKEKLLTSIVQPNAEVAPQYIAFQVETREDENYSAIIANETTLHVTLRMGNGQEVTLPRSKVKGMKSSGQSLMPEGLAAGLTVQSVADLLEFIVQAEPPKTGK